MPPPAGLCPTDHAQHTWSKQTRRSSVHCSTNGELSGRRSGLQRGSGGGGSGLYAAALAAPCNGCAAWLKTSRLGARSRREQPSVCQPRTSSAAPSTSSQVVGRSRRQAAAVAAEPGDAAALAFALRGVISRGGALWQPRHALARSQSALLGGRARASTGCAGAGLTSVNWRALKYSSECRQPSGAGAPEGEVASTKMPTDQP